MKEPERPVTDGVTRAGRESDDIIETGVHAEGREAGRDRSVTETPAWFGPSRLGPFIAGAIGVFAVVLLGAAIYALGNQALPVDSWWHDLMRAWRAPVGIVAAEVLQVLGGTGGVIVVGVALVASFALVRRPWDLCTVVIAILTTEVLTSTFKIAFGRPRPPDSLGSQAMTSFPSGHTSAAATIAVLLALLIGTRLVWILAVSWVVAMAWSRTYLEAHWLTDVIGGAILGASVALLAWAAVDALHRGAASPVVSDPGEG